MLSVVMRRVACASRRPWSGAFAGMKTSAIPIAEETSEQYDEYEASWRVKWSVVCRGRPALAGPDTLLFPVITLRITGRTT